MWLIKILVYKQTSSFNSFRKPGGAKRRVFIRK